MGGGAHQGGEETQAAKVLDREAQTCRLNLVIGQRNDVATVAPSGAAVVAMRV
jgi:hypothetical protein